MQNSEDVGCYHEGNVPDGKGYWCDDCWKFILTQA